jgi:hypothetical protein
MQQTAGSTRHSTAQCLVQRTLDGAQHKVARVIQIPLITLHGAQHKVARVIQIPLITLDGAQQSSTSSSTGGNV